MPANDGDGINTDRTAKRSLLNSTFTIAADNVMISGLRFEISGQDDTAIYVGNYTGLSVRNTVIEGDALYTTRGIEFQELFSGTSPSMPTTSTG